MLRYLLAIVIGLIVLSGCTKKEKIISLDTHGKEFVLLVHSVGKHDANYVDAYFGPDSLKHQAEKLALNLDKIALRTDKLVSNVRGHIPMNQLDTVRKKYLLRMAEAMSYRIDFLEGKKMSFKEESQKIYDAVSPSYPEEYYQNLVNKLDELLPGKGDLQVRWNTYKDQFIIPTEKLDAVFTLAINEGRKRCKEHMPLQDKENFTVEYVKNQPWGAYNWFKGNSYSLIQVNTDLPIAIDRAVDLACHEGYPGHHVYHSRIEEIMYKKRGWVEFSIYPLFSPQALISEGTANFGIKVAFPGEERIAFEKNVLFPAAGLNADEAEKYYSVLELLSKLKYASNDAARMYLDGDMTKEETVDYLMKYQLKSKKRAEQALKFYDTYRSYVINYNVGQDMVENFVNSKGGTADQPEKRWNLFIELLSKPLLPSDLLVK